MLYGKSDTNHSAWKGARGLGLLLMALLFGAALPPVQGASLTLAWDPSTSADVTGYILYWGEEGSNPPQAIDVGLATRRGFTDLVMGRVYVFYVTCYNQLGVESLPSNTVRHEVQDAALGVVVDDADAQFLGAWTKSASAPGYWDTAYRHDGAAGKGLREALFRPTLPAPGFYEVYEWHSATSQRTTNAPVTIQHAGGSQTVTVNQQIDGARWNLLGVFPFAAGTNGLARIETTGTTGYVIADAFRFRPTGVALPDLAAEPGRLRFHALLGDSIPTAAFQVWNAGGGAMDYTATVDVPWLSLPVTAGRSEGERDPLAVMCDATGLSAGLYQGVLTLTAPGAPDSPLRLPVELELDPRITGVVVDDADPTGVKYTGSWPASTAAPGYYAAGYHHDGNTHRGAKSAEFRPVLPEPGYYGVYEWHSTTDRRASNTRMEIVHAAGRAVLAVDQRAGGGQWNLLGVFPFWQGTNGLVRIGNDNADGYVIADAFRFMPTGESLPELSVNRTSIGTRGMQGRLFPGPVLEVRNTGGGVMDYQIAADVNWLRLSSSGGRSAGTVDSIQVSFAAETLAPGTYRGNIMITATPALRSPARIPVTLWVEPAVSGIILDDADTAGLAFAGNWLEGTTVTGYWGAGYEHDGRSGDGQETATYRPTLPSAGQHDVFMWYPSAATRATNVPVAIRHANGTTTILVDQQKTGAQWLKLGRFSFNAGTDGYVRVGNTDTVGYVIADAVRFARVTTTAPAAVPLSMSLAASPDPEAGTLRLGSWLSATGELEISWPTVPGRRYQVWVSEDEGRNWEVAAEVPGQGTLARHALSPSSSGHPVFVRVSEFGGATGGDAPTQ